MSLVQRFESILLSRSQSKPVSSIKNKYKISSNPILATNKIIQPNYCQRVVEKSHEIKRKNTLQKFHELRRKIATKTNDRIKKITIQTITNQIKSKLQEEQILQRLNNSNSFYCSKAIVYKDKKQQQINWKKNIISHASKQRLNNKIKLKQQTELNKTKKITDLVQNSQRKFSENIGCMKEKFTSKRRCNSINLFEDEIFLNTTYKSTFQQFQRPLSQFRSNSQRCRRFQSQSFQQSVVQPWKTQTMPVQNQQQF